MCACDADAGRSGVRVTLTLEHCGATSLGLISVHCGGCYDVPGDFICSRSVKGFICQFHLSDAGLGTLVRCCACVIC
jgi:hypothetical protein